MKPIVGILIHRANRQISNSRFIRDLIGEGTALGADVYAFSPVDLLPKRKLVRGFVPSHKGGWAMRITPWPDVVIDFCRKRSKPYFALRRSRDLFPYANQTFTYKWKAMRLFSAAEEVKRWIPETCLFSEYQLYSMLEKHPLLYVKPGNGTGGHSVVRVAATRNQYLLHARKRSGRLTRRVIASKTVLAQWLKYWTQTEQIRSGNFMIQQGLDLHLMDDRLVDCRLLIQKNGKGEWEVTGKVLRVGGRNSPTTNLLYHDGEALRFREFLERRFGAEQAAAIDLDCEELAFNLVNVIEIRFGSMMEFGLDIGIDVSGRVWLIEVNPKPSHMAFLHANEQELYQKSLRQLIEYAMFLARGGQADIPGIAAEKVKIAEPAETTNPKPEDETTEAGS